MSQKVPNSSSILVKDIMKKTLIFVNPKTTAYQIANMMKEGGISAIFIKENEKFVGIITDRDFAINIGAYSLPLDTPIKKIIPETTYTIGPKDTIWQAADLMHIRNIRKIPVLDKDDVVGIITTTDLVNNFSAATDESMRKAYSQSLSRVFGN